MMDKANGSVSFRRYTFSMFAIMLTLTCLTYLLSSCEQDDIPGFNEEEPEIPTGVPVTVDFRVSEHGFGEDVTVRKAQSSLPPFAGTPYQSTGGSEHTQWFLLSPPSGKPDGASLYMSATLTEDEPSVRLRSTLDSDARVRIMAYKIEPAISPPPANDTTLVAFADYEVSGGSLRPVGPPMTILSGLYMFVAYSFNNDDPMPAFADTTANVITKDAVWGKTPLTSVGVGNSTVLINLAHLFSKITMTVSLDFPDAGLSIDGVINARVSSYEEPKLIVRSGRLIMDPGAMLGYVPFDWDIIPGSGDISVESNPQYIYMNGQTPVTVQINSVIIDNASYSVNGSYAPITFNTVLQGGYSYTFNVHFERGPSGTADILYIDNDTLKAGRWGVDFHSLDSILFFKFGGVVGFSRTIPGGTWAQGLIKFNPINNLNINNYGSLPGISQQDYSASTGRVNISGRYHTNGIQNPNMALGANLSNGKGDPCRLVGLTATQARGMTGAQLADTTLSIWRSSTIDEYIQFVRAPASWEGQSVITNQLNNSNATYWGASGVQNGGWFPIPGNRNSTGIPPLDARTTINTNPNGFLPAIGSYNNGTYNNANTWGEYWSSEIYTSQYPWCLRFSDTTLYPVHQTPTSSNLYLWSMPVRCVKVNL